MKDKTLEDMAENEVDLDILRHYKSELTAWRDKAVREARIDELGWVRLHYGNYIAQTYAGDKAMTMTIQDRIKELTK